MTIFAEVREDQSKGISRGLEDPSSKVKVKYKKIYLFFESNSIHDIQQL